MYGFDMNRFESLKRQRELLDKEMNIMQSGFNQMPNININNQLPMQHDNFDFNGKWVNNEQEARMYIGMNKPIALFEKDENIFYMSNNGELRKYRFEEVFEKTGSDIQTERISALESKFDKLLKALGVDDDEQIISDDAGKQIK